MGYHAEGVDIEKNEMDTGAFKKMVERVVKDFPNIKVVGTTLRGVKTALINDWSAIMWADGKFYDGPEFPNLEIEDRVGGGDGFASGFNLRASSPARRLRNASTLASPTAPS